MHTTKDYSKSPAKHFDAVEDIKSWLGQKKYDEISPQMAAVKDPNQFSFYCMIAGIQGLPVIAWYELHHGEDSWAKASEQYPEETQK